MPRPDAARVCVPIVDQGSRLSSSPLGILPVGHVLSTGDAPYLVTKSPNLVLIRLFHGVGPFQQVERTQPSLDAFHMEPSGVGSVGGAARS